jgi:hypothetical protein
MSWLILLKIKLRNVYHNQHHGVFALPPKSEN